MTQETGFGAVHANLAAERANYAGAALNAAKRRTPHRLSLAPVWDVCENWKLAVDTGITTSPDRAARARMVYVEPGAIHSPDKNLDLALGVIRNVMDNSADSWLTTLGLTWQFS